MIAIDRVSERATQAISLGAHLGLATSDPGLEGAVAAFSRYGVDAALITAATRSADPLELAAKLLRDRGRISVIGDVGMGVSRGTCTEKRFRSRCLAPTVRAAMIRVMKKAVRTIRLALSAGPRSEIWKPFWISCPGSLQVGSLLAHQFPVEEGGKAYAAVEAGAYTGIIDYHAPGDVRSSSRTSLPVCVGTAAERKLRVGCIGAGGFAREIIFPYLRSSAGLLLESVASSTGAAAASARTGFGFTLAESPSALLDNPDLDAVFILTRHNSHAAYVKAPLIQVKRSSSKSRWRPTASSWRRCEPLMQEPWRKASRLSSW